MDVCEFNWKHFLFLTSMIIVPRIINRPLDSQTCIYKNQTFHPMPSPLLIFFKLKLSIKKTLKVYTQKQSRWRTPWSFM